MGQSVRQILNNISISDKETLIIRIKNLTHKSLRDPQILRNSVGF